MYTSCSILFVTLASSFAISVKNFILSFATSKFKSFFKFLILNSANDIALSMYFCQERNYDYYAFATPVDENPAVKHFQKVAAELQVVLPY